MKILRAPLKTHWRVIARERSDRSNLHKSSVCWRLPRPFGARNDRTSRFLEAPLRSFVATISLLTLFACGATSTNANLDKARFALDSCSTSNTGPCNTAASESLALLTGDPTNVQAAMLRSSALATIGGFDMLSLVSTISETATDDIKFKSMHDTVLSTVTNVRELGNSIDTMLPPIYTGTLAAGSTYYESYHFQLGVLHAFNSFILPTMIAQPTATSPVTPTDIVATDKDEVHADFIAADDDLITSGITDPSVNGWDIVRTVRQNYCVLKNASGTATGFTLPILQDLMLCQLCDGVTDTSICAKPASALTTPDFQSGTTTKCSDFNFSTCSNAGPTD